MSTKNTPAIAEELYEYLAKLVQNGANGEAVMSTTFKIISGISKPNLARAIFYTLDSFPGRKALLTRVAEVNGDATETALVKTIIDACEVANNQRREVAHAVMIVDYRSDIKTKKLTPIRIVNPKTGGHGKVVTTEWLEDLLGKSFQALEKKGRPAFEKLCQKRGVPPEVDFQ